MNVANAIFVVLLHCWTVWGDGIRITSLEVPEHVGKGEEAVLKCCYDLASHTLYSVKWYRNGREFFRYMPSEEPTTAIHEIAGVTVDEEISNGEMVVLRNVELNSSGRYKCEVISDAPEFHTADKSAAMMVVVVPQEKPIIQGTQHEYHIGDTARLTCTSASSRPPAQLAWHINGREALPEYVHVLPSTKFADGLEQTKLELKFVVSRAHFQHGEMTLRCSAKISSLYYKTQQHSVDGQFTYNVPVMESRDISAISGDKGSSSSSSASSSSSSCAKKHLSSQVVMLMISLLSMLGLVSFLSQDLSQS